MGITFEKDNNGKVLVNLKGRLLGLVPSMYVYEHPKDDTMILISLDPLLESSDKALHIDFDLITNPIWPDRETAVRKLNSDFFFELESGGGSVPGSVDTVADSTPISGFRAIAQTSSGIEHFNPFNVLGYSKCIGVSANVALPGDPLKIIYNGVLSGGSYTKGDTYYAGNNGILTNIVPVTGITQIIGIAISTTELLVDIKIPIQLL